MDEEVVLSPSQAFEYGIGMNVYYGFRIGMMRGSINVIEQKRSKYKLINTVDVPHYMTINRDRLKEIDKYYECW